MLRYAITDLGAVPSPLASERRAGRQLRWLADLRRWVAEGVDFVQLREKSLEAGEVFALAEAGRNALQALAAAGSSCPRLLINGRPDIAAAAQADGVHLTARSGELTPEQVREVFRRAGRPRCCVSVSSHKVEQVIAARDGGADLILYGPVFEKRVAGEVVAGGSGLAQLESACRAAGGVPVLALGGITGANAAVCLEAGAAGIAAIRLFAPAALPGMREKMKL